MSKPISQLRTSAFDEIANSMNTAAKEAGFENPRITFIYGVGTEDCCDVDDEGLDSLYQVYVTAQVTEGYAEPQSTYYSVTGTTYCTDRQNVLQTFIGDLDDLKVNTAEDTYDYANHEHHPVVDDLAEALGYFFDETQLPYYWHRVFETA